MYPSEENPAFGVFVKNFVTQMNASSDLLITDKVVIIQQGGNVGKRALKYLHFYSQIISACMANSFDKIYVHFPLQVAPILLLWPMNNKQLILNFHGSDVMGQGKQFELLRFITKKNIKKTALVVVPSQFIANEVMHKFNVTKERVFISPSGGVDKQFFYPMDKVKARKQTKLDEQFTIGFISRLDAGKGWNVFLEALAILKKSGQFVFQALVVGDGQQKEDFLTKITRLDLEENISYVGRKKQSDLNAYFNSLDVFVASSTLMESLGLNGLEAMSCGIPVAGSDRAGIATYVKDRFNGYLFKPGDPKDLADKLKQYYFLQETEKKILSRQALRTAAEYESTYTNQQLTERIINL